MRHPVGHPSLCQRHSSAPTRPEGSLNARVEMTQPALPGSVSSRYAGCRSKYGRGAAGVLALSNISFRVAEGEFIVVVGPVRLRQVHPAQRSWLASCRRPRVSADLKGTPITGPRRDIGVVFQSPVLFPWRSVLGNVMLPADVQGLDQDEMKKRALDLIKLVGLQGLREPLSARAVGRHAAARRHRHAR